MSNIFTRYVDRIRGSGNWAVTLPPMDGPLRPNTRIDTAEKIASLNMPDNLVWHGGEVLLSSGARLISLEPSGDLNELWEATSTITCLASHESGVLAVGLDEGKLLIRGGVHDGREYTSFDDMPLIALSALAFSDENTVFACHASQNHKVGDWKYDLMSHGASGSVWKIDLVSGKATCLADKLAFPNGITCTDDDHILVSESWRHQILRISSDGKVEIILDELPGYPSRLVANQENKDIWLCIFAPRTQLIEFVLREKEYREQMIATIEPEYWIAPSLHHPISYLEPMQGGGLKQLGELKPWAPSRSIGMVARMDSQGNLLESLHYRADGTRHGVTSCLPQGETLFICSKGGDTILSSTI